MSTFDDAIESRIIFTFDHTKYRESIQSVQKTDLEILIDLHVLRVTESKKSFLACRLSVCLFMYTIIQKNNWASSTKFGMWSYMIKCLTGIAYEQNRPTGLASALIAQFGFLAKSALKMRCTRNFFIQKLLQITIRNFWGKYFFDRPMGLASALIAQFGFLAKSALKMHCTKIIFRQKLLQIKSCNFYVM